METEKNQGNIIFAKNLHPVVSFRIIQFQGPHENLYSRIRNFFLLLIIFISLYIFCLKMRLILYLVL